MNAHSFLSRLCHVRIPQRAAVTLVVMVMSIWIVPTHLAANYAEKVSKLARECHLGKQSRCAKIN